MARSLAARLSSWIPSAIGMACVAGQLALSDAGGWGRPALITALAGLAMVAIGVSLLWSLGLRRESIGTRLVIAVPIVLSVLLVVALMLESDFRRLGARG